MKVFIKIIISNIKKYYKYILICLVILLLIVLGVVINKRQLKNDFNIQKINNYYSNTITVNITGEILYPGVYQLKQNSNINDLIVEAKGLTENGEIAYINVNKVLEDGESIYIPKKDSINNNRININIASIDELINLKGIGVEKASSIILYRTTYGPFNYLEDLLNVPGITNNILLNIKNEIKLS